MFVSSYLAFPAVCSCVSETPALIITEPVLLEQTGFTRVTDVGLLEQSDSLNQMGKLTPLDTAWKGSVIFCCK